DQYHLRAAVFEEEFGMTIAELQSKTTAELQEIARQLEVNGYSKMRKDTLIMEILRRETEKEGLLLTQGILEVLPDGYGFLRVDGPTPSQADGYASPSPIRRIHLRTGDVVPGQVRPPTGSERDYALLKVMAVNLAGPEQAMRRPSFDDLTPIYPNERIRLEV